MFRFIYILMVLALVTLYGCNSVNSDTDGAFIWQEIDRFEDNERLQFVSIGEENNEIYVGVSDEWFISTNEGQSFEEFQQPDTLVFRSIERHDGVFYGITHVKAETLLDVFVVIFRNTLYKSVDGNNWEPALGEFFMVDFELDASGFIHISREGGVSSINTLDGTASENLFLPEQGTNGGSNFTSVFEIDENNVVYVASDAGIYSTNDNGISWSLLPEQPLGSEDIIALAIDDQQRFFAHTSRGFFLSEDLGNTWVAILSVMYVDPNAENGRLLPLNPIDIAFRDDNFVYALNEDGFFVGSKDELSRFTEAGPTRNNNGSNRVTEFFSYPNGDALTVTANGRLFYGKRNPDFPFWSQ